MRMRHGAQRLQLCLEKGLVDLALVDRDALLDADADHFAPIDAQLLRQLVRRQVVCHVAPSSHKKARRLVARTGWSDLACRCGIQRARPPRVPTSESIIALGDGRKGASADWAEGDGRSRSG